MWEPRPRAYVVSVCLATAPLLSRRRRPPQVVDMLGCRLPVVALAFPALPELLADGVTGLAVANDEGADAAIAAHLIRLMQDVCVPVSPVPAVMGSTGRHWCWCPLGRFV